MLGKRLKQLRGNRTQKHVAKNLNLSRARYSHYENERSEPDVETLQRLADYYNVSIDYLLGRTNHPSPHQETEALEVKDSNDLKQIISERKTLYYGSNMLELDNEMKKFLDLQMQMILTYVKEKNPQENGDNED